MTFLFIESIEKHERKEKLAEKQLTKYILREYMRRLDDSTFYFHAITNLHYKYPTDIVPCEIFF